MTSTPTEDVDTARAELAVLERELIEHRERVAAARRALPKLAVSDYTFTRRDGSTVKLSDLFGEQQYIIIQHLMFRPGTSAPCPMCSMWASAYSGIVKYINARAAFACVSKAAHDELDRVANERNWTFPWLSSFGTSFNSDFKVESDTESQRPGVSVFERGEDGQLYHTYQTVVHKTREIDLLSPVWQMFDLLPEGRGDYIPEGDYSVL